MRIITGLALILTAAIALAKQPAPKPVLQPAPQSSPNPTNLFMSASQISDLIEKAKSDRKANQPNVLEPILELGGYDGHLEYRASVGNAAQHETEAELFYVIDGSATLTTGGKLVNERRTDAPTSTVPQSRVALSATSPKATGFLFPRTRRTGSAPSTACSCCTLCTCRANSLPSTRSFCSSGPVSS